jgi:hypothetical protein
MKKIKSLGLSLVVLLLSIGIVGCGGIITPVPKIEVTKASGNAIIIRKNSFVGSAVYYIVKLDGKNIAHIRTGQYFSIPLSVGTHSIGVKCFGGIFPIWHEDIVTTEIYDNTTVNFIINPNIICADIKLIDNKKAKLILQESYKILLN